MSRCLFASLLLFAHATAVAGARDVVWERWYSVLLQGRPAGWMHAAVLRDGALLVTEEALSVTVRRGADAVTVEVGSRFTETEAGQPVEARSAQRLGADEVVQILRFGREDVELVTRQGNRERSQRLPRPDGEWHTPEGVRRLVEREIARGAREVRYRSLEAAAGPRPVETVMRLVGRESVEVLGAIVPGLAWDITSSALPGAVERSHTDEKGVLLRSTLSLLPDVPFSVVQADRDLAQARANPPELLASTLVAPKGALPQPRSLARAVYRVGAAVLPSSAQVLETIPQTGAQQVRPAPDGTFLVTVDLESAALPAERPGEDYLRPSALVDSDDPEVRLLAEKALQGARTASSTDQAGALRRFVRGFVERRDLSVGFASASQVARTAQGDCTEHAVLLAALLRAAGIPSRLVSGVVYLEHFLGRQGVFGYHMWTQAWLGEEGRGRWVDLDATLDGTSFDAAHISLAVSPLTDGDFGNELIKLAPLLGRLSIEVVEAR